MILLAKIQMLESSIINKIAAGEVVERPSAVVKELMENSVDAGATNIIVEIKDGGTTQIRVTDNGHGIPKEDVKIAFTLHATSKITNFEDLENVLTMGFRGEALSTICAVSQLEMLTKTRAELTGSRVEIHAGEVISEQDIGVTEGTTTIVRNLFYNTPARRKFLKKPSTEGSYISDVINKMAIGHPDISIKYINNGSVILQTNGKNDLKSVLLNVYGKDIATRVLPVSYKRNGFHISGLIGKPELCRANRSYGTFFINKRVVKSELLQSAVEEAYKTRLFGGKFPVFVLNLEINPKEVDVNVHPTKLEVRFRDEDEIIKYMYEAVDSTLSKSNLIPTVQMPQKKSAHLFPTNTWQQETVSAEIAPKQTMIGLSKINTALAKDENVVENVDKMAHLTLTVKPKTENTTFRLNDSAAEFQQVFEQPIREEVTQIEKSEKKQSLFKDYKIIGQIFHTYWIVEQNNAVYMIDQHALHERELFEKLTSKFKNEKILSQRLLEPQVLRLSEKEKETLNENLEMIKQFGFEVEYSVDNEIFIKSVPYIFNKPAHSNFFMEIIDRLQETTSAIENIYETKFEIIASMSCKAAVKANDRLSYAETHRLIENALKLENPFTCPHGRPTIVQLSKYEIEKMFKR